MGIVDSFLVFLFGWRWFSEIWKEKRGLDHDELKCRTFFFFKCVVPFHANFYCWSQRKHSFIFYVLCFSCNGNMAPLHLGTLSGTNRLQVVESEQTCLISAVVKTELNWNRTSCFPLGNFSVYLELGSQICLLNSTNDLETEFSGDCFRF